MTTEGTDTEVNGQRDNVQVLEMVFRDRGVEDHSRPHRTAAAALSLVLMGTMGGVGWAKTGISGQDLLGWARDTAGLAPAGKVSAPSSVPLSRAGALARTPAAGASSAVR